MIGRIAVRFSGIGFHLKRDESRTCGQNKSQILLHGQSYYHWLLSLKKGTVRVVYSIVFVCAGITRISVTAFTSCAGLSVKVTANTATPASFGSTSVLAPFSISIHIL